RLAAPARSCRGAVVEHDGSTRDQPIVVCPTCSKPTHIIAIRLRPSFNRNPHPAFGHPLPAGDGKIPSPAWRRCRAAADEGGQGLGQYHPSPGLRIGSCEVGPDSPIGRQPFISLFFLLPPRRVTGGKTTSTIRMSPFLPQSRPNACPQRNETGSPETTSKTLSIATSHQPTVGVSLETFARRNGVVWRPSP